MRAAEVCVTQQGCPERATDLRNAIELVQPVDRPKPAGEVYLFWQRAAEGPVSVKALRRALPEIDADQIATWLDGCDPCGAGQVAPVTWAAAVMQTVIAERPRDSATALILADAALSLALGWRRVLPLLALGLKRADLRKAGEDLRLACHRAISAAAAEVTREAADLVRRIARLTEVAPKLRAKGSDEAFAMFLTQDAAAPTSLTSLRSDRAARRFCDRLVALGTVRELTGRDTFRLYGI